MINSLFQTAAAFGEERQDEIEMYANPKDSASNYHSTVKPKEKGRHNACLSSTQREGFEPPCGCPQTDFESAPL